MMLTSSEAWIEIALRLGLAMIAGAIVGLNRDLRNKPAGVRTHALVSLGTALSVLIFVPPGDDVQQRWDAVSRVVQGVLTGIGFLGAGVILRDPANRHVTGLTTAAAIWLAALLGCACGIGSYLPVVIALAFALVVVLFGGPFERYFRRVRDAVGADDDEPG